MDTLHRQFITLLVAAATVASAACAPTMGQQGELGFAYGADDAIAFVSVRRPLAADCQAEIVVYASDADQAQPDIVWGDEVMREASPVEVTAARSTNPDILEVVGTQGPRVILRGASAGKAELEIATADGKDVIEMEVADTAEVEVSHLAWESELATPDNTVLLYGGTAHFDLTRRDQQGRTLACSEPERGVDIKPADGVRIVNHPADLHHLRLQIDSPGRVQIVPGGGSPLTLSTTPPEAVDRVSIDVVDSPDATGPVSIDAGNSLVFRVNVGTATGGYALALDGLLEVSSQTPDVCEIASLSQLASDGLYAVRGLEPGTCEFSATLGGETASRGFTVVSGD